MRFSESRTGSPHTRSRYNVIRPPDESVDKAAPSSAQRYGSLCTGSG